MQPGCAGAQDRAEGGGYDGWDECLRHKAGPPATPALAAAANPASAPPSKLGDVAGAKGLSLIAKALNEETRRYLVTESERETSLAHAAVRAAQAEVERIKTDEKAGPDAGAAAKAQFDEAMAELKVQQDAYSKLNLCLNLASNADDPSELDLKRWSRCLPPPFPCTRASSRSILFKRTTPSILGRYRCHVRAV
eukprot:SAG25_NODE_2332_length_1713_cov_2.264560_2_plen_194_part_00